MGAVGAPWEHTVYLPSLYFLWGWCRFPPEKSSGHQRLRLQISPGMEKLSPSTFPISSVGRSASPKTFFQCPPLLGCICSHWKCLCLLVINIFIHISLSYLSLCNLNFRFLPPLSTLDWGLVLLAAIKQFQVFPIWRCICPLCQCYCLLLPCCLLINAPSTDLLLKTLLLFSYPRNQWNTVHNDTRQTFQNRSAHHCCLPILSFMLLIVWCLTHHRIP